MPGTENVVVVGREYSTENVIIIGRSPLPTTGSYTPRVNIELIGAKDGNNDTYFTPEIFIHNSEITIQVTWNGRRLDEGQDYEVQESGGVGTGYDSIVLTGWNSPKVFLPKSHHKIIGDYYIT